MTQHKTQTTPTLASMTPETAQTIYEGKDALRYLLNITSENDRPNTRANTVLDKTFDASGKSIRLRLENLWEELCKKNP